MRHFVRSAVFAGALTFAAVLGPSGQAGPEPPVAATTIDGPLLSEVEAVGDVQHLDGLDGTRSLLPFLPGSQADFSPDGSQIVYLGTAPGSGAAPSDAVLVRDAGGATSVLARMLADDVRWSGDGMYVVASATDPGTGIWSLWRLTPGASPVEVLRTPKDRSGSFFDIDPTSDLVTYVSNQDIYTVDAMTGSAGQLTHNCETVDTCGGPYRMISLDWAPTGDRIAVLYQQPASDPTLTTERLGWLTRDAEAPDPIVVYDPAVLANTPRVSPSGARIALEIDDLTINGSHTEVVDATGANVATLLPPLADVAWQPCPTICPVFATPPATAPAEMAIGKASSGAAGGRITARATGRSHLTIGAGAWSAASNIVRAR